MTYRSVSSSYYAIHITLSRYLSFGWISLCHWIVIMGKRWKKSKHQQNIIQKNIIGIEGSAWQSRNIRKDREDGHHSRRQRPLLGSPTKMPLTSVRRKGFSVCRSRRVYFKKSTQNRFTFSGHLPADGCFCCAIWWRWKRRDATQKVPR